MFLLFNRLFFFKYLHHLPYKTLLRLQKMEEQKLIYSGKLLTDSAVLKDILRTYEGQENHTVHLVCTTKLQKFNKTTNPISTSSIRTDGTQSKLLGFIIILGNYGKY